MLRTSRDSGTTRRYAGNGRELIERVKYMTAEFAKTATSVDASLSYLKKRSKPQKPGRMRHAVHPYSFGEIHQPVKVSGLNRNTSPAGGSLFLVMDQGMWSDAGADQCETI